MSTLTELLGGVTGAVVAEQGGTVVLLSPRHLTLAHAEKIQDKLTEYVPGVKFVVAKLTGQQG